MVKRAYNFYAGPATLPLAVLEKAKEELLDYRGIGMSVMEISHRSKAFDEIINGTKDLLTELYKIPDNYTMIPMNIMLDGKVPDFVVTGTWAKKALKEAQNLGGARVVATSEDANFNYIPKELDLSPDASYVHIASNETIGGIQWQSYPDTGDLCRGTEEPGTGRSDPRDCER